MRLRPWHNRKKWAAGFTMVEVALSIAIIAFAMIAILGVLPTGLEVQKNNREDTVINEDGTYFLELLQNGSEGDADLEHYVQFIEIRRGGQRQRFSAGNSDLPWNTRTIVGLLSTPRRFENDAVASEVFADVYAISGVLSEKSAILRGNEAARQTAFEYRLKVDIHPYRSYASQSLNLLNRMGQTEAGQRELNRLRALSDSLYVLRLTFRWPILPDGSVGNEKRTFSTLVAGDLERRDGNLFFFEPSSFQAAK